MIFLFIIVLIVLAVYIFTHQKKFGKQPVGESLKRMQQSKNYRNGSFQNIHHTPDLTEGVSYYAVLKEFLFQRSKRSKPASILPTAKTDLHNLPNNENVLVWFGHSSYFMQVDGKKILVDPVFSGAASPVRFTTKAFAGSNVYTTNDLPPINYLFISHDHWDHLDYETIKALKPKISKVICGLGVGEHLKSWGYNADIIFEKDWDEHFSLDSGFEVSTVSARHFSGRSFRRNKSLWLSYVLNTPSMKIFIGGDSGYDTHFCEAEKKYGPFDLAILECGQYDKSWRYIHMLPPEILQAAKDLQAKRLLPLHWGKFALANHDWDTPIKQLMAANEEAKIPLLTPMIGEAVHLNNEEQVFSKWWENVD